jgi:pentatricopeptide repeat protein
LGSDEPGEQIGNYVENQGLPLTSSYLGSALIDMYTRCGHVGRAYSVFSRMEPKVVIAWNSMIRGLALNGFAEDSISLYENMVADVQPNEITFVALLTACTHAGLVNQGLTFFEDMKRKHSVSPQVEHCACIVDLLCKSGRLWESYKFICDMEVEPNAVIWSTLLSACRALANVELAKLLRTSSWCWSPRTPPSTFSCPTSTLTPGSGVM